MLWGLLFLAQVPWAGELGVGPGTPCSTGGTSTAKTPVSFINGHSVGVRPDQSVSLPLLAVLMWDLLYILGYNISIRLVFRWFSVIVALY